MTNSIRGQIMSPIGAVLALALALALAACGGSAATSSARQPSASKTGSAHSGISVVVIHMFGFHPSSLTVAPGATVTVRNTDTTTHTLTDKADPKLFSTGDIRPGQAKTFTAPMKPGSYPYICLIHQFMTGTLIVR